MHQEVGGHPGQNCGQSGTVARDLEQAAVAVWDQGGDNQ